MNDLSQKQLVVIGAGNIGRILLERLRAAGVPLDHLAKLAELNRLGVEAEWEFNEWCHGVSGQPMGYPHQAWSAGMYIFAYHCVQNESLPDFWPVNEPDNA